MKNKNWKKIIVALCVVVGLLIAGIGYYFRQLKVEQEEIVREAVKLVAESGKIPYKCPLKVLESNLIVELGKVKEVHLTLACGDKILKAKVDWQNKRVVSVEDI